MARTETLQGALDAQSDEQLVALARAGGDGAFAILVGRYRSKLLSYCRRFENGSTNAEDILQQTLLNAWRSLAAGREVTDVRPWLYRIAHNVAVSGLRRVQVVPVPVADDGLVASAADELEERTAMRQALAGMSALPSPQREVMLDSTIGGLSHQELAHSHGLSVGAVRGLIYRARTALRAAVAGLIPGPLVSWFARRGPGGPATLLGGLTGGGSAALGGTLVKGGALLVAAGAIAGVTVRGVESRTPPRGALRTDARHPVPHRPLALPAALAALSVASGHGGTAPAVEIVGTSGGVLQMPVTVARGASHVTAAGPARGPAQSRLSIVPPAATPVTPGGGGTIVSVPEVTPSTPTGGASRSGGGDGSTHGDGRGLGGGGSSGGDGSAGSTATSLAGSDSPARAPGGGSSTLTFQSSQGGDGGHSENRNAAPAGGSGEGGAGADQGSGGGGRRGSSGADGRSRSLGSGH